MLLIDAVWRGFSFIGKRTKGSINICSLIVPSLAIWYTFPYQISDEKEFEHG